MCQRYGLLSVEICKMLSYEEEEKQGKIFSIHLMTTS